MDPVTLAVIGLGVSAGTSLIGFSQQMSAADIAKREAGVAAKGEELAAVQREADRKGRLARNLATQTAQAGAGGISAFEGSPLTALQESIRVEETATERDVFQSRLSALTTRARGSIAAQQTRAGATVGLVGNLGSLATKSASVMKAQ